MSEGREPEQPVIRHPLQGIKVLDLSRYAPGPFCTMILGDLGADIIKIEETGTPGVRRAGQEEGRSALPPSQEIAPPDSPYNPLNRNKRSIGLNLKKDGGKQVFRKLAEEADVVVEGFRPGVAQRLGLDYPALRQLNPRLIYCAITGYGQDGPYSELVGHDVNYISHAGAMSIMSQGSGTPTPPGNLIGDIAAGGMQAAIGILAALMARESTGEGQFVDISITDGTVYMLSLYLGAFFQYGRVPVEKERVDAAPYNNIYHTADGKLISIGCLEPWFFANLCRALDCEDLIPHQTDLGKAEEIRERLQGIFITKSRDAWFELLSGEDIPVSKVNTFADLTADAHLRHREMILELPYFGGWIRQPGIPIKLSVTPGAIRSIGMPPGWHTNEILAELGYGAEDIMALQRDGAVASELENREDG